MKRTYCERCGRETLASADTRNASLSVRLDACMRGPLGDRDCDAFAAGRRAAFKEAMKIARAKMPNAYGLNTFTKTIRAALKAPRRTK